jgi:hypothetical protein
LIHAERKTGELILNNGKATLTIFFQNGQIISSAGALSKGMRLGSLLKSNKLLSEEQLLHYLDKAKRLNKKLGEVLVQNGVISGDTLKKFLLFQIKETICGLLLWKDGRFAFKERLDGLSGEIMFELAPKQILLESKKWSKLKRAIPNERVIFQVKRETSKNTGNLKTEELRLLFLIDGKRDVKEIMEKTGYPRIKLIMEDLKEELGKGADRILEQCKKEIDAASKTFLKDLSSSGDIEKSLNSIKEYISKSKVKPADMIAAFSQIVSFLFNQQLQFLGPKSVSKSISRLEQELASLPDYQSGFGKQILNLIKEEVFQCN